MSSSNARVLVVEDHPATARGLKMLLEISGYRVLLARDVATALALAAMSEFDVLLCDLILPDGDGWDLLEMLSDDRAIRAIAFSGLHGPEQIKRSRAAGFTEHVVKGAPAEDLLRALEHALTGSRPERIAVAV